METSVNSTPPALESQPAAATPVVASPAAVPVMNQTPPAPVTPMQPAAGAATMETGGNTGGGGIKGFFEGMNIVDIGFMMLGTAALAYSIYHWRMKIMFHKKEYVEIDQHLNRHDAQIAALKKSTTPPAVKTSAVGMNGMLRRFGRA